MLVANDVLQAINTARLRAEVPCSPVLVLSAIEDAGRMLAALSTCLDRIHRCLWPEARLALGLGDAPRAEPHPQPDVPTALG